MVLFDADALLDFPRYGIQIPALDSRKTRTLAALKSHPLLRNREAEWLISHIDERLGADDLQRVHSPEYTAGFFDGRVVERFKAAYELVNPDGSYNRFDPDNAERPLEKMLPYLLKMQAGTYQGALIGLKTGFCQYLGGGAHHGHVNFGHGFCPLNDTAIAVRRLQAEGRVKRVWVIDVDAHKGDGTAAIFSGDDSVVTLSIHMANGWPLDGSLPPGHPSYIPSDFDIAVAAGEENEYLSRLETALDKLSETGVADFAVVLAGVDPWEHDELPSTSLLKLSSDQMACRDNLVYRFLEEKGLPSLWLTAGGYGKESWRMHTQFLSEVLPRRLA